MKRYARPIIIGATVLALGVAGTMAASAWTVPAKKATVNVRAAKMPKGADVSPSTHGSNAFVSWSAQEVLPGVRMTAYVVTAHDISPARHPDVAHTVTASGADLLSCTFTAAELGTGRYRWTLTPKFENWTGNEGRQSSAISFPASPASLLADTVTAMAVSVSPPTIDPTPVAPSPAAVGSSTLPPATTPPIDSPEPDPTPSVTTKSPEPEKSVSPTADMTPSERPSAVDPLPVESAE